MEEHGGDLEILTRADMNIQGRNGNGGSYHADENTRAPSGRFQHIHDQLLLVERELWPLDRERERALAEIAGLRTRAEKAEHEIAALRKLTGASAIDPLEHARLIKELDVLRQEVELYRHGRAVRMGEFDESPRRWWHFWKRQDEE